MQVISDDRMAGRGRGQRIYIYTHCAYISMNAHACIKRHVRVC